ncbi:G-protein coupled receptor 55 [Alligator mississippiensis]|uniref:G-protein coupled receptor 55 n=1 Tax=Alligator mississippiensis TaxID=8496 RepID=UPI0003D10158|nr:G-protein coupled receptor 55 [Alligator mississippiensis]
MNTSNFKECSFIHVDTIIKSLQQAIYIPTFALGLILNLLALLVFCCFQKKWIESSIYMINLVLADLLLLFSLPFKMSDVKQGPQGLLCHFLESLYFVNMYGSIFIAACISFDRYFAIRHPFKARVFRSPRMAGIACFCVWVLVWLGSIPIYKSNHSGKFRCFHNMSDNTWQTSVIVSVEIFGFLIPLTVMVYCSIQIIQTLLRHKTEGKEWTEQFACIRTIAANLIVFVVCFTPFHLGIFLQFLVRKHVIMDCNTKQHISLFIQVAMCIANINCCLDAICYYFAAKEFRKKGDFRLLIKSFTFSQGCPE